MPGTDRDGRKVELPGTTLAVILGDFGRDASIRFCAALARAERRHLAGLLGEGRPFFDEYRRMTLALVGDLPFVKERVLGGLGAVPLDERVLVGFPGGPTPADVEERLSATAVEAASGPLGRGVRHVLVLLPCNTLAPVSWAMAERFTEVGALTDALGDSGLGGRAAALARTLVDDVRPRFPTVPEAVVGEAVRRGSSALLPLGTEGIAGVYREAVRRLGHALQVVEPDRAGQDAVLEAIGAAIEGGARRQEACRGLERLVAGARDRHGEALLAVEACTDLNYGTALDSGEVYAEEAVRLAYGLTDPDGA